MFGKRFKGGMAFRMGTHEFCKLLNCERCPADVENVWGSRSPPNVIRLEPAISHVTYR
jgi:hypothetical protein